ncbi:Armadillo-like helical [Penicillium expansum]|nr:Armadillo-like helical [Penicillium expansum]
MHLKDDNDQVRTAAIDALSHRPCLSETIVNRIVAILDERNSTKQAALQALKHLSNLPKTVLDKIADCIKNRDPLIKTAAIKGLGGRSYLSDSPDILNKIATYIYHADAGGEVGVTAGVIAAAIQAFSIGDPSILKDWLEVIALRINDGDKEVRNAVVQVLIRQSDLSKEHLSLLAARINDEDEKVRLGAVKFLEKQETLTDETLRIMASQIINLLNQREMLHSELLLRGLAHRFLLPLLLRSFKTHLAWYFRDGESYLETNNATKSRGRCDEVDIEVEMESAREEAGMPPVAVLYS